MHDTFVTLLERALATKSKSTVLKSLAWFIPVCGLLALLASKTPEAAWLSYGFGIMTLLGMLSYIGAYWYFALTDKEALRSEHFTLKKLAIEKGFVGDDITGYMKIAERDEPLSLPAPDEEKGGEDK